MNTVSNQEHSCPWASIYTPLDRSIPQIRLIEILPCHAEDDIVSCELKTVALGPDVCYAALSYVWGDPDHTENILVNGVLLPVTVNLESALWQFRETGFPENEYTPKTRQLWVDAVCINQNDIQERTHQLTLMGSIYRNAASVLSWLGLPDGNRHDLAFQIVRWLLRIVYGTVPDLVGFRGIDPEKINRIKRACIEWLVSLGSVRGNVHWTAFDRIKESKYWNRMWIIQEMALARSALSHWFVCGNEVIPCSELQTFGTVLRLLYQSDIRNSDVPNADEGLIWTKLLSSNVLLLPMNAGPARLIQDIMQTNPSNGHLVECICRSAYDTSAHDARDFVYAVISVTPNNIEPDYNKKIRDVYLDAVLSDGIMSCLKDCLLHSGSGRSYENDHNLPSWLPNFSELRTNHIFATDELSPFLDKLKLQSAEIIQRDTLRIHGACYGRVELAMPLIFTIVSVEALEKFLLQFFVDYLVNFRGFTAIDGTPAKIEWCLDNQPLRTFIDVLGCGFPTRNTIAIKGLPGLKFSWAELSILNIFIDGTCCSKDEKTAALVRLGLPPDQSLGRFLTTAFLGQKFIDAAREVKEIKQYRNLATTRELASLVYNATHKTLFQTDKGHLGIGPRNLQPGDLVCALDKFPASSLLRKSGLYWEHVGPCYVPDLYGMDAAEMIMKGEIRVETFEIR
ncbi:heterokaryon incompatibility protein-domain-containing protein [Hypomontagnella monticulosa]|nr:heterokaryon incompatibility protein-domain-containing protein [Hypomontagnella monticulosa]